MANFLEQQKKNLKYIIRQNAKTSMATHLGLAPLKRFKDFEMLHQSYIRATPVNNYSGWVKMLRTITGGNSVIPAEDMIRVPNLLSSKKDVSFVYHGRKVLPVSSNILNDYSVLERKLFSILSAYGLGISRKSFHMFEFIPEQAEFFCYFEQVTSRRSGLVHDIYGGKAQNLSNVQEEGRSRHQLMHFFYKQLKEKGHQVDVLFAPPRLLTDFALFMAQQEGRFISMCDLCPNLKVYAPTAEMITPYRTELKYLFRDMPGLKWVQTVANAMGVMSCQNDPNIQGRMTMLPSSKVFFEFVPVQDLDKSGRFYKNYRRLHAGHIEIGQEYLLLLSNDAGLYAYNTGWVVKVAGLNPLQFSWNRSQHILNSFGESIPVSTLCRIVGELNDTIGAHGLFIRDFMVAPQSHKLRHNWMLEMSRPVQEVDKRVLLTIAKRLHGELGVVCESYRNGLFHGNFYPPEISFVSMGTFVSLPDNMIFRHIDDTTDNVKINEVKRLAGIQIVNINPDDLVD